MFPSHQLLGEVVSEAIGVLGSSSKMMIDSHLRRATEISRDRKSLVRRLALRDLVLGKSASRADRKQLRRDPNETGKQQLFAIEFWTKTRHRVEQTPRQPFARARCITNMGAQIGVQFLEIAGAPA